MLRVTFDKHLKKKSDGVTIGSSLGPVLANSFLYPSE